MCGGLSQPPMHIVWQVWGGKSRGLRSVLLMGLISFSDHILLDNLGVVVVTGNMQFLAVVDRMP